MRPLRSHANPDTRLSSPASHLPKRRRNGHLPSCEPCRKGKLACDHQLPFCGRCVRRGLAGGVEKEQGVGVGDEGKDERTTCVYIDAPMTRKVRIGDDRARADYRTQITEDEQHEAGGEQSGDQEEVSHQTETIEMSSDRRRVRPRSEYMEKQNKTRERNCEVRTDNLEESRAEVNAGGNNNRNQTTHNTGRNEVISDSKQANMSTRSEVHGRARPKGTQYSASGNTRSQVQSSSINIGGSADVDTTRASSDSRLGTENEVTTIPTSQHISSNTILRGPAISEATQPKPLSPTPHASRDWKTANYSQSARYWGPTSFKTVFEKFVEGPRGGASTLGGVGVTLNRKRLGRTRVGGKAKGEVVGKEEERDETNQDVEDILKIGEERRKNPSSWPFGQPLLGRNRPTAYNVRVEMITKALYNIPSFSTCNVLLTRYSYMIDSFLPEPLIRHCINTLFSTFSASLSSPRTPESLAPLIEALLLNEETPLPPSPDEGLAWLNTFNGPNIRFEMLGLLFCWFGRGYLSWEDDHPLLKEKNDGLRGEAADMDRRQRAWRMNECADVCGKMCDYSDTINEIVVAFRISILVLESTVIGDESYSNHHRHSSMITVAIAAGLHRLPLIPPTQVTTASEFKRRIFNSVYNMDKCHSCLNGTPPGISRKYCRIYPALDLSDQELFLPRKEMQRVIQEGLDGDGWNIKGEIHAATWMRVALELHKVKEEILELALGVDVKVGWEMISSLHQRNQQIHLSRPPQFRLPTHPLSHVSPASSSPPSNQPKGLLLFIRLASELETLQNTFLLHRLAVANTNSTSLTAEQSNTARQGLYDTAKRMLELVLAFWEWRDGLRGLEWCFDWFVTDSGVPAAGIICVELLKSSTSTSTSASKPSSSYNNKQHHSPSHLSPSRPPGPAITTTTAAPGKTFTFSKSEAIQKLTLFHAFLGWIRQTDGNYALLRRVRGVVGRVLTFVLDGGSAQAQAQAKAQSKRKAQVRSQKRSLDTSSTGNAAETEIQNPGMENKEGEGAGRGKRVRREDGGKEKEGQGEEEEEGEKEGVADEEGGDDDGFPTVRAGSDGQGGRQACGDGNANANASAENREAGNRTAKEIDPPPAAVVAISSSSASSGIYNNFGTNDMNTHIHTSSFMDETNRGGNAIRSRSRGFDSAGISASANFKEINTDIHMDGNMNIPPIQMRMDSGSGSGSGWESFSIDDGFGAGMGMDCMEVGMGMGMGMDMDTNMEINISEMWGQVDWLNSGGDWMWLGMDE